MLTIEQISCGFGRQEILHDISLTIPEGKITAIVGQSGCGKTTFLNSLTKIYDITDGEILLNGEQVDPKKQNIAYIFQGGRLL